MITKTLILAYYKQSLKTIVKTNLPNYISSRVFFQLGENRLIYLSMFFLKNLNSAKCNYKIDNKELLVIICCFE